MNTATAITLQPHELEDLLVRAAEKGALRAFKDLTVYSLGEACKVLDMAYPTLQRRVKAGKIKTIDGKITGAEIARYLQINV